MKKFCIILFALVMSVLAFAGCSGTTDFGSGLGGEQNCDFKVLGNGGSAVQYGNYLYFINGTRGYDDPDGTANVEGEVVKGALYRAQLNGTASGSDFIVERDETSGLKLVATETTNYLGEKIYATNVELVSSKTIGTDGYEDGGLFIYNEYIYFASPCNAKNREGEVMYEYNEFYRTNLKTGKTQKLHTSSTANHTEAYAFYYFNDAVYLVYVEVETDHSIVSVKIDEKTGKTEKTTLAEKVSDVVLPVKSEYYKGIDTNTVYDFVYYGGNGSNVDSYRTDKLMTFMRPDGSEKTVFSSGKDATLIGLEGGMVFYKMTYGLNTAIMATDMHNYFMGTQTDSDGHTERNSESYYEAHKNEEYNGAFAADKVVIDVAAVANATTIECFVPGYGVDTNAVYVVLSAANSADSAKTDLTLYTPAGDVVTIASATAAEFQAATTDKIYYTANNTTLCLYEIDFNGENEKEIYTNLSTATFMLDFVDDYAVFFGKVDNGAFDGYTLFYDLDGLEGVNEAFFVGERKDGETSSKVGSIKLNTYDVKIAYYVGEELDVEGLTLTAYAYADEDGEVKVLEGLESVAVTADMVTGFNSEAASDSLTLTVTYEGQTATYVVTVTEGEAEESSCATVAVNPSDFIGGIGMLILAMGAVLLVLKRKPVRA